MIGDDHRTVPGDTMQLAAQFTDGRVGLQQGLCSDAPDAQDQLRVHQLDLAEQVRDAGAHFLRLRIAVVRRPRLEDVRDEHLLALQADRLEHRVEQLPGAADERLALAVLVGAGRLADHHPLRVAVADAEHALRPRLVQRAQRAALDGALQLRPAGLRFGGRQRRCGGAPRRSADGARPRRSQTSIVERFEIGHAPRVHRLRRYPPSAGRFFLTTLRHSQNSGADSA